MGLQPHETPPTHPSKNQIRGEAAPTAPNPTKLGHPERVPPSRDESKDPHLYFVLYQGTTPAALKPARQFFKKYGRSVGLQPHELRPIFREIKSAGKAALKPDPPPVGRARS